MNSHSFPAPGASILTAREDEAPLTGEAPPARSGSPRQGDSRVRSRLLRFTRVRRAAASLLAVALAVPLLLAAAPVSEANAEEQPAEGSIRLVGRNSTLEGRVELFLNGRWGRVCDWYWGEREAAVACRQLGGWRGKSLYLEPGGDGSGPVHMNRVDCKGDESRLTDCAWEYKFGNICTQYAWTRCYTDNQVPVFITQAAQRVAENTTAVVTLWARDENFDPITFSIVGGADEALFSMTGAALAFRTAPDYDAPGDADKDNVYEVTVQANDGKNGTANLNMRVTVTDDISDEPAEGSIRLVGREAPLAGRVEVFLNRQWGKVCDDGWSYGFYSNAEVVCKQLGYRGGIALVAAHRYLGYSDRDQQYVMDDVQCNGSESRLIDCKYTHKHDCFTPVEDAGVICTAPPGPPGVTAAFFGVPLEHLRQAFSFELRFSENFPGRLNFKLLRDEALQVTNGRVTGAKRVTPGQNQRWTITVEPASSEDVTVTLPAATDCAATGAVCTEAGKKLTNTVLVKVPGPAMLSAEDAATREGADAAVSFRVMLSRAALREATVDYATADGTAKAGEDYTAARGTLTFAAGEMAKTVEVAALADGTVEGAESFKLVFSNPQGISIEDGEAVGTVTDTDAEAAPPAPKPAPAPLTAAFHGAPAEHDGRRAFSFELRFSENFPGKLRYKTLRDEALEVTNGRVRKAARVTRGQNRRWRIEVKPTSSGDVVVTLPAGSVRTEAGRVLSNAATVTVQGPPQLTVADAEAQEGPDSGVEFRVTLSRPASGTVTVNYATADGTAVAGEDYTATSGTLTFAAGETAKTVSVPVLDDAHDEGRETFRFKLSNATGAVIADGEAEGTIVNTDPMPRAWLARFGRTVADQVLDAVGARLEGGGRTRMTLGGHEVLLGEAARTGEALAGLRGEPWPSGWRAGLEGRRGGSLAREVSMSELLVGSSFHVASAAVGAGSGWSLWGRGARTGFEGREGALMLEGDVTTGLVGADYESGRALMGVALASSAGEGSYGERGEIESSLEGVYPYVRYAVSEGVTVWGAAGFGKGDLTLKPEGAAQVETDLTMSMAAAGARGVLRTTGGLALALRSDLAFVRSESDAAAGLAASEADTSRVRLALEASREMRLTAGVFTPSAELGVRFDGGDAERGVGFEVGGGLRYGSGGLTVEVQTRGLVTHEEKDYEEGGVSASVRYTPGADGRGLSLRVGSAWGAARGGIERLWLQRAAADLTRAGGFEPGSSLEAEAGYGFDFGYGLLTPYTGVAVTESGDVWRAGARWKLGPAFDLALEARLTEPAGGEDTENDLLLRGAGRW